MSEERGYPALGPRVWGVLLRNEWFKARHRVAFIVTLGLFAFIQVMQHWDSALRARRDQDFTFALPEAWGAILGSDSTLLLIFGSIVVIMLASSEFTWRTARQNVIDGLDKTQWYWGKVIMLGIVAVCFLTTQLLIGVSAALIGTDLGAATGPVVPFSALAATFALLLAFANVGGLALLCGLTVRNSGPAMAVWFFWITLGEQLFSGDDPADRAGGRAGARPAALQRLPAGAPVLALRRRDLSGYGRAGAGGGGGGAGATEHVPVGRPQRRLGGALHRRRLRDLSQARSLIRTSSSPFSASSAWEAEARER